MLCPICHPNSSVYDHSYFIVDKPFGGLLMYANTPEEAEAKYRSLLSRWLRELKNKTSARLLRGGFRVISLCEDWKTRYNLHANIQI